MCHWNRIHSYIGDWLYLLVWWSKWLCRAQPVQPAIGPMCDIDPGGKICLQWHESKSSFVLHIYTEYLCMVFIYSNFLGMELPWQLRGQLSSVLNLCTELYQEFVTISETAVHMGTVLMALKSPAHPSPWPEALTAIRSCGFMFRCKYLTSLLLLSIYILKYIFFYYKLLWFLLYIIVGSIYWFFGNYVDRLVILSLLSILG